MYAFFYEIRTDQVATALKLLLFYNTLNNKLILTCVHKYLHFQRDKQTY